MRPDILLVDDAVDQLQLIRTVFAMVAPTLKVATSESGDDALRLLRDSPATRPMVVLLDVSMPGKSGIDVLKAMKADPDLRRIPVCMFSHGDIPRDIAAAYEHGASFYFKKPVGLDRLKTFADVFARVWFELAVHCP